MSVAARIVVDPDSGGLRFDGVGALTNSSSRLLLDYPAPLRSRLLDYLFTPRYGASLHLLKLEIGADTNSTTTAEPAHRRSRTQPGAERGWSWWMAREAKARNPDILLYGLLWGAPGWLDGGLWSSDHVDYLVDWLDCARAQGLRIDYIGGANESYHPPPTTEFFVALKAALRRTHPDVRVVATDSHTPPDYWWAATAMRRDPAFAAAVDVLGEHDVCGWRTGYERCHVSPDAAAVRAAGTPLWNSEQSSQDVEAGAPALARAMNRHYIDGRVTANVNWPAIAAFYGDTATGGTGLILADRPWSGEYVVGPSVWVDAHTTQFAQPGWRYVDSGCGDLPGGGSHVALRDPGTGDVTIVVETVDASASQCLELRLPESAAARELIWWSTDLRSTDPDDWFVPGGVVRPTKGTYVVEVPPGHVSTFSTTTGQRRADDHRPTRTANARLPLPYAEDFAHGTDVDAALPPYWQDLQGAFAIVPASRGRHGNALRQVVTAEPIRWHDSRLPPATLFGDPLWWGDYRVEVDVLLDDHPVELLGRVEYYDADCLLGYHLSVAPDGHWSLSTQDRDTHRTVLASGAADVRPRRWSRLALDFRGNVVTALLDDAVLARSTDSRHTSGQVALAVDGWGVAEFADVRITPTSTPPRLARVRRVVASSAHGRLHEHHTYGATRAIDGRPETRWISEFDPPAPLPQTLTLDLGSPQGTHGLIYRPPIQGKDVDAIVTGYRVAVSVDGEAYRIVAEGAWEATIATKVAPWTPGAPARFVRFEATESTTGGAAARAVEVALDPFPDGWWGVPSAPPTMRGAPS